MMQSMIFSFSIFKCRFFNYVHFRIPSVPMPRVHASGAHSAAGGKLVAAGKYAFRR